MPSTSLIIALVFAALVGIALLWLLFHYTHRYMHLCLELSHWLHLFTRSACPHCSGTGVEIKTREKGPRRSRRGSRRREGRARALSMVEAGTEWNAIAPRQPERVQRPQRTLLAAPSVQDQDAFGPWQGWQQSAEYQTYAQPVAYQQDPQTVNPQPFVQGVRLTSPFHMPAARHGGESVQSAPVRLRPPRSTPTERSEPQPQRTRKKEPRVRRVDLIHIIDEYPDCIKEGIKRARERLISPSGSSKSKESADAEILRTSIPVGSQRHANPVYHQPQYPQAATQAPAAYEQQQYPLSVN
jgi:hypothetical protein